MRQAFLVIFCILMSISSFSKDASKKMKKRLFKIERDIVAGQYQKSLMLNKEQIIYMMGKTDPKSKWMLAEAYFREAQILDLKKESISNVLQSFNLGVGVVENAFGEHSAEMCRALAIKAEILLNREEVKKAEKVLKLAFQTIKNEKLPTSLIEELSITKARVQQKQGYFTSALSTLEKIEYRYEKPASTLFKPKGKFQKIEHLKTKQAYARFLMKKAEVLIEMGHYSKADSLLNGNELWIASNIGEKDVVYLENILMYGECESRSEHPELIEARMDEARARINSTKVYKMSNWSPAFLRTLEYLVYWEYDRRRFKKGNEYKNKLELAIRSGYGGKSPELNKIVMMEAFRALQKEELDKAHELIKDIEAKPNWLLEDKANKLRLYDLEYIYEDKKANYKRGEEILENKIAFALREIYSEPYPVYHQLQVTKAIHLMDYMHQFYEAHAIFQTSFAGVVRKQFSPMHERYIHFTNKYAESFQHLDHYQKAYSLLNYTIKYVAEIFGRDSEKYAEELNKLAEVNMFIGKFADSKRQLHEAKQVFEQYYSGRDANYNVGTLGHIYKNLARWHSFEGDYNKAEEYLSKAQDVVSSAPYDLEDLDDFAMIQIQKGKYRSTQNLLLQSIETKLMNYGEDCKELIPSYTHLAELLLLTGEYNAADEFINKAVKLALHFYSDSSVKYADPLFVQGQILESLGDYEEAYNAFVTTERIQRKAYGGKSLKLAETLMELAKSDYYFEKDFLKSQSLMYQALTIVREGLGTQNLRYAEALKRTAEFYILAGKWKDAEKKLEEAIHVIESFSALKKVRASGVLAAEIYEIFGSIERDQKKYEEAIEYYGMARNMLKNVFNESHPEYVHATSQLAKLNYMNGQKEEAFELIVESTDHYKDFVNRFFPELPEREKTKFWKKMKGDFEFYYYMAMERVSEQPRLAQKVFDMALNTKAVLLNSSRDIREAVVQSDDPALLGKFNLLVEKKELMLAASGMSEELLENSKVDVDQLAREIRDLEKELGAQSGMYLDSYQEFTMKTVKNALGENEYAVEIIRYRTFDQGFTDEVHYAFIIVNAKTKKKPDVVVFKNGSELESGFFKYYRNAVRFQINDEQSYQEYWEKIDKLIPDGATIYLSPDGVYNQINVQGLLDKSGKYVLEKNTVVLLNNTKDLVKQSLEEKSEVNKSVFLLGNPTFYLEGNKNGSVTDLPGAENEIDELSSVFIQNGWAVELYKNRIATEQVFKDIGEPGHGIIHVATHGFFYESPRKEATVTEDYEEDKDLIHPMLRSGLLLANGGGIVDDKDLKHYNQRDGVLTALEAMNLNLSNTAMVVLSACETGRGDIQNGEGVYGLQRAFLVAGAKTVVMSLFKVSDEITSEFMKAFYSSWLKIGDKRAAFKAAQLQIKSKHPAVIYWGAFVMIES